MPPVTTTKAQREARRDAAITLYLAGRTVRQIAGNRRLYLCAWIAVNHVTISRDVNLRLVAVHKDLKDTARATQLSRYGATGYA